MRELVMIVSDLYLDGSETGAPVDARLDGLSRLSRFGTARALARGWRAWLARWAGVPRLAAASPAAVAAAGAQALPLDALDAPWVWLADPVHLSASLRSVHLAALLKLDAAEQAELRGEFDELFADTGLRLAPIASGGFLAVGPRLGGLAEASDPARWLGSSVAERRGPHRAGLAPTRLSSEIEMWLHEHPVNVRRSRAGRLPVSALWMWGGGPRIPLAEREPVVRPLGDRRASIELFGDDAFMEGLSRSLGRRPAPAPSNLAALAPRGAWRTVVQLELLGEAAAGRRSGPESASQTVVEVLERDWIAPALERLDRRDVERLIVIAGDRQVSLDRLAGWKRWRRPRAALAALATS